MNDLEPRGSGAPLAGGSDEVQKDVAAERAAPASAAAPPFGADPSRLPFA